MQRINILKFILLQPANQLRLICGSVFFQVYKLFLYGHLWHFYEWCNGLKFCVLDRPDWYTIEMSISSVQWSHAPYKHKNGLHKAFTSDLRKIFTEAVRSFIDLTVCYRRKFRAFLCRNLASQTPKGDICTCWPLNILSSDVTTPLSHSKCKTLFSTRKQRNKKRIRSAGYRISLLVTHAMTHAAQCKNVYHLTLSPICVNSKEAIWLLAKVASKGRKTYKIITPDSGNDRKIKNYCWLDTSLLISQKSIAEVYAAETTKWL